MLVIKYNKIGRAKFISHLDLLKHMNKILRRAEIEVEFSKGFNPHQLIFFSPATSIGSQSHCDYMAVATKMDKGEFMQKFNENVIEGIECTKVFSMLKNPNLAGISRFAEYEFEITENDKNKIVESFENDDFEISFFQKGEEKIQKARGLMKSYEIDGNLCKVVFSTGNSSLRADRYLNSLGIETNVMKTKLFVESEGKLFEADEFLEKSEIII